MLLSNKFEQALTLPDRAGRGVFSYEISFERLTGGAGGASPGTYDTDPTSPYFHTFPHLEVRFPCTGQNVWTPNVTGALDLLGEFSPEGEVLFPPGCPRVRVVGGSGNWGISITQTKLGDPNFEKSERRYEPQDRKLLHFLQGGEDPEIFAIPSGHTRIGCDEGTQTIKNLDDGTNLVLNNTGAMLPSGTRIQLLVAAPSVIIWTGFRR